MRVLWLPLPFRNAVSRRSSRSIKVSADVDVIRGKSDGLDGGTLARNSASHGLPRRACPFGDAGSIPTSGECEISSRIERPAAGRQGQCV